MKKASCPAVRPQAFTLIELLVVIAIAVAAYTAENQTLLPPGIETIDGINSPVWEALRPYSGGGERNVSIPIWECPSIAIKVHNERPEYITPSYSANRFLTPDRRSEEGGGPKCPFDQVKTLSVNRMSEVFLLIDADQRSPSGWSNSILLGGIFQKSDGNPTDAEKPVIGSPITEPDTDIVSGHVRYRHSGKANAVFLDGHVAPFQKGEIKEKNNYFNC